MSIGLSRTLPLALGTVALALGAAGCGDDGKSAATTVVERETVTRTVPAPVQTTTTPATTPQTTTTAAPLTYQAAEQVLRKRGFGPLNGPRDWRTDQALRVLVGVRPGTSDGGQQQAFFFADGRFLGTDATAASGRITVLDQEDAAITLAYGLYRPSDSIESPSGGEAEVTFAWDGTRLTPQQPIPSAAADAPLSRR